MQFISEAAASAAEVLRPWDRRWSVIVHVATHVQARAFGFQVVNAAQEEIQKGECIPSSSAVAADHLLQLLQDRAAVVVGGGADPKAIETLIAAIESLYNEYFSQGPYQDWQRKANVKILGKKGEAVPGSNSLAGVTSNSWIRQLAELALYFILWTEATNLKHTPELLWLIYHIMLCSTNHAKACAVLDAPGGGYSVNFWRNLTIPPDDQGPVAAAVYQGFVHGVLLPVRNRHGNAFRLGSLIYSGPNPYLGQSAAADGASLAARQCDGLDQLLKSKGADLETTLVEVLEWDLHYFGDGCIFLDTVVQPVFNFMAEQIALMGAAGEQPALRLGYDDINESACIAAVLADLRRKLDKEVGRGQDSWDRLLSYFTNQAKETSAVLNANMTEQDVRAAMVRSLQRYPRTALRVDKMAAAIKKVIAAAPSPADAAPGASVTGYGCVGGSAPVGHLLASLRVTDSLWAQLFKKSFLETRSMGAVAVAFSRVYIMHAVMLCWMTLWAYMIPDLSITAMFTGRYKKENPDNPDEVLNGSFYQDHGMLIAECASWGLVVHAILHVVKDVLMMQLLWAPSAIRVCQKVDRVSTRKGKSISAHLQKYVIGNNLKEGEDVVEVAPAVHNSKLLQLHNLVTLLFWLACSFLLLDSHIPSWPLHRYLANSGFEQRSGIPVWALYGLIYVGLWLLHQFWGAVMDLLPDRLGGVVGSVFRKDGRRAADFFFPYGNIGNSQNFKRHVINILLWVLVIFVKFLFDFFVVLRPLANRVARTLIRALENAAASGSPASWDRWAMSVILILALWVSAAFLIFYNTGLFWQLVGALYSTVVLGMHRRVGHVKSWYDLVWAFPGLDKKLAKRMLPAAQAAFTDEQVDAVAALATKDTSRAVSDTGGLTGIPEAPLAGVPPCPPSEVLFAQAWNKVIDDLRQRDLIDNLERDRLVYVEVCPSAHGGWWLLPRFVAAGAATEVANAGVSSATHIEVICRSFNMLLWLLAQMNVIDTPRMSSLVLVASSAAKHQAATRRAKVSDVIAAAEVLAGTKELLVKLRKKLEDKRDVDVSDLDTQLLLEAVFNDLKRMSPKNIPEAYGTAVVSTHWNHSPGAPQTELPVQRLVALKVVNWLLDMLQLTHGEAAPATSEARRVLCFFAASLHNPKMPTAATVACTRSMTTLTPHYGEDVMYALNKTVAEAEMGVQGLSGGDDNTFLVNVRGENTETLNYLRVMYKVEWMNFVERLISSQEVKQWVQENGIALPPASDIRPRNFAPGGELHPWLMEMLSFASMRGQLLQRTVHGMMYYEAALQQLILMQCRSELARAAHGYAADLQAAGQLQPQDASSWVQQVCEEAALLLAQKKFSYVVSSQNLGEFSEDGNVGKRWLTHCIRNELAKRYPALKIAYIDLENIAEAYTDKGRYLPLSSGDSGAAATAVNVTRRKRTKGADKDYPKLLCRQYSVLLQWDKQAQCVKEQYRVRLPINLETETGVIIGEGKPENQNHAAIFCHSETLQTIDCNQDGYLVEAMKLPNLLAEFEGKHGRSIRNSIAPQKKGYKPRGGWRQGPALVGFREWIFSEDSGALAEFAAATERSFGTTVQRVMHNPGAVRFHYGHPDVWDKLFTMTNGGVSKSTKGLHVSEDVFGGYNVMLRGRDITYVDYHAVGKGRDMGFETILAFEGKIAGGNGEQVVSRDIQRLARRLNFTRLMSWYHTGNGFFVNTSLLMFSLLVNAWVVLLLAMSRNSAVGSTVVSEVLGLLGGLQLLQLGSLSLLVYVATVWLEDGLLVTMKNVLKQLVAGSFLFYVFRGQTTAHYFVSDVKYGGAKYAATGRGYKLQATPFMDLFQQYARSHMWYGAHLLVLVLVSVSVGLQLSFVAVWSYIIVIAALLMAPFWFNPFTWDWDRNKMAASEFTAWMSGHKPAGKAKLLWRRFNDDQLKQAADDDHKQLGRTLNNVLGLVRLLPIAVSIGFAIVGMLDTWWKSLIMIAAVNLLFCMLILCWSIADKLEAMKGAAFMSRVVKFLLKMLVLVGLVIMFVFVVRPEQRYLYQVIVRVLYVEFELARMSTRLLLDFCPGYQPARRLVDRLCWIADMVVGLLLLLLLFIGSLFGLLTRYQAAVLFSMGYAADYLAQQNLANSEVGRLARELQELQQKDKLAGRKSSPGGRGTGGGGGGGGDGGGGGGGGAGPQAGVRAAAVSPSQASQPSTHHRSPQAAAKQATAAALDADVAAKTLQRLGELGMQQLESAKAHQLASSMSIARWDEAHNGLEASTESAAGVANSDSSTPAVTDRNKACSITRSAVGCHTISESSDQRLSSISPADPNQHQQARRVGSPGSSTATSAMKPQTHMLQPTDHVLQPNGQGSAPSWPNIGTSQPDFTQDRAHSNDGDAAVDDAAITPARGRAATDSGTMQGWGSLG